MKVKIQQSNATYDINFNHNVDEKITGATIFRNKKFLHSLTREFEEIKVVAEKVQVNVEGLAKRILVHALKGLPGTIAISMNIDTKMVEVACTNSIAMAKAIVSLCVENKWNLIHLLPIKGHIIKNNYPGRAKTRKWVLTELLRAAHIPKEERREIWETYRVQTKVPRWESTTKRLGDLLSKDYSAEQLNNDSLRLNGQTKEKKSFKIKIF